MNTDVFKEYSTPADLQPYVRRILAGFLNEHVILEQKPAATGYSYLGWLAKGAWSGTVNDKLEFDTTIHGPLHLSGQIDDAKIKARLTGPFAHILAEFTALGQHQFLGIPGIKTFQRAQNPNAFNNVKLWWIYNKLQNVPNDASNSDLIDYFISSLELAPQSTTHLPAYLITAVDNMESSNGYCRIGDVAASAGISERQFRREFIHSVGLKPKTFCNVLQVNTAFTILLKQHNTELSDLSAECGFTDQAHLCRAFKRFLGDSPMSITDSTEAIFVKFVGHCRSTNITKEKTW